MNLNIISLPTKARPRKAQCNVLQACLEIDITHRTVNSLTLTKDTNSDHQIKQSHWFKKTISGLYTTYSAKH